MTNIIDLLSQNTDPRCLRQAMGCLANLSERHDTHLFIRRHNFHSLVLPHYNNKDIGLCRELSRFLSNLTSVHDNHPTLIGVGIINALMIGCCNTDAIVTRLAVLGIMNLTTLPENHRDVMQTKCHNILIDIAANDKRVFHVLTRTGDPVSTEDVNGEVIKNIQPTTPRSLGKLVFIY